MSIEAMSWALNHPTLENPTSRHVLLALANHAGHDGRGAFPAISTIQRYTRLSDRAIQLHLRKLEEAGVIKRCAPEIVAAYINNPNARPIGYDLLMNTGGGEPRSPGG